MSRYDDAMPDEDAMTYLEEALKKRKTPALSVVTEQVFLRKEGAARTTFLEGYLYLSARAAKDWYDRHGREHGVSVGECIRAANIGMNIAAFRFIEASPDRLPHFGEFAKPFIHSELERLKLLRP